MGYIPRDLAGGECEARGSAAELDEQGLHAVNKYQCWWATPLAECVGVVGMR